MRHNNLDGLDLRLEYDKAHTIEDELDAQISDNIGREKLVLCGDEGDRTFENVSYLWVDPEYKAELSPGQREAYELLLSIQQSTVYTITTIGKLAEAQGLKSPFPCLERLVNLQSLGAIHGLRKMYE